MPVEKISKNKKYRSECNGKSKDLPVLQLFKFQSSKPSISNMTVACNEDRQRQLSKTAGHPEKVGTPPVQTDTFNGFCASRWIAHP